MKRIIPIALVLAAVAGGGYWAWTTRPASAPADRLQLYGNVDIREVDLAFNASEHVVEIRVEEGDRVAPGQLLARLHTAKLEAAVKAAEAGARAQQQVLARLRAGNRPEEIQRARAQADAAAAQAEIAQIDFERQLKLDRQKLAAPEDVDHARAAANAARAEVRAAEAAYALLRAGARQEDVAEAQARLDALQAELQQARERLRDAELSAPAAGIVRERILEPGDMATPQTPVLTLALLDPLWVRAFVAEPGSRPACAPKYGPTAFRTRSTGAGSVSSRRPPSSLPRRWRPPTCARGWCTRYGSWSAIPTASCDWACRPRSRFRSTSRTPPAAPTPAAERRGPTASWPPPATHPAWP